MGFLVFQGKIEIPEIIIFMVYMFKNIIILLSYRVPHLLNMKKVMIVFFVVY